MTAFSLSADASEAGLYFELRELPSGGATPATLLKSFRESVGSWQDWADHFLLNSTQDPSWLLLATRMPLMFRFVGQQVRSTIDGDFLVASAYLPADAAAQAALATLLAMNTPLGGTAASSMQAASAKPLTVDEMLDKTMSISFYARIAAVCGRRRRG